MPSSTITFAPTECARPMRLEFDLVKNAVAADARGLASGELVLVITTTNDTIVPLSPRA